MRSRTRSRGLALCLFYHKQRFGREPCIRRAAVPCVRWIEHRRAASETDVDTRRQVERNLAGFPAVLWNDHTRGGFFACKASPILISSLWFYQKGWRKQSLTHKAMLLIKMGSSLRQWRARFDKSEVMITTEDEAPEY
jgi:hypothetical protein